MQDGFFIKIRKQVALKMIGGSFMKNSMSNIGFTKRVLTFGLICTVMMSSSVIAFAKTETIPETMPAGTILTYNENVKPLITSDDHAQALSLNYSGKENIGSQEQLNEEEAVYAKIKDEAKDCAVHVLNNDLPAPAPGMVVIYGSDGQINRIYSPEPEIMPFASIPNPNSALPYPSRLPEGVYQYGSYPNTITIVNSHVLGEGRFTVYRAGVGGSGTVGSSGKTLGTGDVATKMSVDNPKHNTALSARALDTNVLKTVYKNDIGSMPNSVLDVYFWGWSDPYFGYMYSDTLSFAGRYYYEY